MSVPDPIPEPNAAAALAFAMNVFARVPKGDKVAFEAHLTGVLIVFWGALWGTFGTEYAQGFIESQLRGMESGGADVFTPPKLQ